MQLERNTRICHVCRKRVQVSIYSSHYNRCLQDQRNSRRTLIARLPNRDAQHQHNQWPRHLWGASQNQARLQSSHESSQSRSSSPPFQPRCFARRSPLFQPISSASRQPPHRSRVESIQQSRSPSPSQRRRAPSPSRSLSQSGSQPQIRQQSSRSPSFSHSESPQIRERIPDQRVLAQQRQRAPSPEPSISESPPRRRAEAPVASQRFPCFLCGYQMALDELDTHPLNCPSRETRCEDCNSTYPHTLLRQHYDVCPERISRRQREERESREASMRRARQTAIRRISNSGRNLAVESDSVVVERRSYEDQSRDLFRNQIARDRERPLVQPPSQPPAQQRSRSVQRSQSPSQQLSEARPPLDISVDRRAVAELQRLQSRQPNRAEPSSEQHESRSINIFGVNPGRQPNRERPVNIVSARRNVRQPRPILPNPGRIDNSHPIPITRQMMQAYSYNEFRAWLSDNDNPHDDLDEDEGTNDENRIRELREVLMSSHSVEERFRLAEQLRQQMQMATIRARIRERMRHEEKDDEDRPLTKRQLNSIPTKKYTYERKEGAEMCSICTQNLRKNSKVRDFKCKHLFHRKCIDEWLGRNNRCPLCKADLKESIQRSTSVQKKKCGNQQDPSVSSSVSRSVSQPSHGLVQERHSLQ